MPVTVTTRCVSLNPECNMLMEGKKVSSLGKAALRFSFQIATPLPISLTYPLLHPNTHNTLLASKVVKWVRKLKEVHHHTAQQLLLGNTCLPMDVLVPVYKSNILSITIPKHYIEMQSIQFMGLKLHNTCN